MKSHRIRILTLSALAFAFACNDEETTHPDASTPSNAEAHDGGSASDIALSVGVAQSLPKDDAKRFAEVGAEAKIRSMATTSLRSSGKWDPSMSVTVTIDEFRLRTTAQVAWVGMMAGADILGAQVAVYKDGQVIKTQKVSATSVKGGMVGAKEQKRLDGLVVEFADNVAKLL